MSLIQIPEEALLHLVLSVSIDELLQLSQLNVQFNQFLSKKYVLKQVAIKNEIPTPKSLLQAYEYSDLPASKKLEEAIKNDDIESVTRMMDIFQWLKPRDIFIYASRHGKVEILLYSLLLREYSSEDYGFALKNASIKGHFDVIKILLSQGVSINKEDYNIVIENTIRKGYKDITNYLLN